jgi:hypothetical protein
MAQWTSAGVPHHWIRRGTQAALDRVRDRVNDSVWWILHLKQLWKKNKEFSCTFFHKQMQSKLAKILAFQLALT